MSGFEFRPAVRKATSVIVGLAGSTGSGKTYSALRLATGLAGPDGRIAFVDTERGRALHYAPAPGESADPAAGSFAFSHAELNAPFTPERYTEAIRAADESGAHVIVVDSGSHEWEGDGGVLDMQLAEYERLGAREAVKILSWAAPKREHKRMVSRLVQCSAHLVICLRAAEKLKLVKGADGKQTIIPAAERPLAERWEPVCEKDLPYEFTASFVLLPGEPGVPVPVKLQARHRAFFPEGRQLDEAAGAALAAWARGERAAAPSPGPLTRGEVRELERLINTAAARSGSGITPEDVEGWELAIHDKNAEAVRAGIRELRGLLEGAA